MAKVCVFCGASPETSTKEHIIPRWLIELTGDPKRKARFGLNKTLNAGFNQREYSFDQFTFPACEACNNRYAVLESSAKSIIMAVLGDESVSAVDVSVLLDWLDKVRVGLWLGMNQLDNNYASVDPNFYISSRIAQYDRMLIIEKSDATRPKLNFGGVDTLSFALTPSVFVLIINNYYFTNISYMFLLSRRLGFPYPTDMYVLSGDERVEANFAIGRERIMRPLIRKQMTHRGKVVYQPMYSGGLMTNSGELYDSDYVREHSISSASGIGNVFMESRNRLEEYSTEEKMRLVPSHIHADEKLFISSAINVCKWQNWLVQYLPSTARLSDHERRYVKRRFQMGVTLNNKLIQHHEKLL